MTIWNRRELLCKAAVGTAALALGPALFSEEPHPYVSPLNKIRDEDEIALGQRFAAQLEAEEPIVSNSLVDRYLGSLIAPLAAQSQRPTLPYSVKLINSHVPDAVSLPGGFLYVHRGLVELCASEGELVAALAHEMGHVVGRHVVNQLLLSFAAQSVLKPVLDNLNQQNGVIEKILVKFGGAAAMLAMLHFSRRDEEQADLLGFYEMLRAGWNPNGFLDLFAQFDKLEKSSAGAPIPFLSAHSPTPERAAAIRHELTLVTVPASAATDSVKFQIFKSAMGLLPEPPNLPENGQPQS